MKKAVPKKGAARALKQSTSGPDSSHAALWQEFARVARRLHMLTNDGVTTLDQPMMESVIQDCCCILYKSVKAGNSAAQNVQRVTTKKCLMMLRDTIKLGGGAAMNAVPDLVQATLTGCEIISDSFNEEISRKAVAEWASKQAAWPVVLSAKPNSYQAIQPYLKRLGVGTKSTPPTSAKTRISGEDRWTKIAVALKGKLEKFGVVLRLEAAGSLPVESPETQAVMNQVLSEARKYPKGTQAKFAALPPKLSLQSCAAGWKAARAVFDVDLETNPAWGKELLDAVKVPAEAVVRTKKRDAGSQLRSVRTESKNIIVKSVRKAFKRLVASVDQ